MGLGLKPKFAPKVHRKEEIPSDELKEVPPYTPPGEVKKDKKGQKDTFWIKAQQSSGHESQRQQKESEDVEKEAPTDDTDAIQQPESDSAEQDSADGPLNLKPSMKFLGKGEKADKPKKFQEQK